METTACQKVNQATPMQRLAAHQLGKRRTGATFSTETGEEDPSQRIDEQVTEKGHGYRRQQPGQPASRRRAQQRSPLHQLLPFRDPRLPVGFDGPGLDGCRRVGYDGVVGELRRQVHCLVRREDEPGEWDLLLEGGA